MNLPLSKEGEGMIPLMFDGRAVELRTGSEFGQSPSFIPFELIFRRIPAAGFRVHWGIHDELPRRTEM